MASQYAPQALLGSLRRWQVWTLRPVARAYVVAVVCLDLGLTAAVLAAATPRVSLIHLGVYLALVACAVITVEATRSIREVRGTVMRDLQGVWFLTIAILLPPGFALLAPLLISAYRLLRIRRMFPYRRVFSGATISLSYGAASVVFHSAMGTAPRTGAHAAAWLVLAAGCAVLASFINLALVLVAQRLADPEVTIRDAMGGRTELVADVAEASMSVMVAFGVAIAPLVIILVPYPLVLCQRYLMYQQHVSRPQVDAQSGVLTSVIWRYEADVEAFRAQRTHTPLAVVLAEIDDFSGIDDAGPGAAGAVLRAVAAALAEKLPPAAHVGRLRGAGFAIVLPGAGEDEARRWAVRVRDQIAAEPVAAESDDQRVFVLRPTVSVGVAGQTDFGKTMTELIALADAALRRARDSGGNQVRVAA
jgi:diguanylate cyclase (GGDEF)-like protein